MTIYYFGQLQQTIEFVFKNAKLINYRVTTIASISCIINRCDLYFQFREYINILISLKGMGPTLAKSLSITTYLLKIYVY